MDEQLQKRLNDYGITPPESIWAAVAADLADQEDGRLLRNKLRQAEIAPPEHSWTNLYKTISSRNFGKVVFARTLFQSGSFKKMAAIVAGVVLVGSIYLVINNSNSKKLQLADTKLAEEPAAPEKQPAPAMVTKKPVFAQLTASLPKISSLYSSIRFKKKVPAEPTRTLYKSVVKEKQPLELPVVSVAARPIRNENGDIIQDQSLLARLNDKYVSVTGPNGEKTRISAKFLHLLLYLNHDSELTLDEGIFNQAFQESLFWKSTIQNWKNSISQTAFIPTATNFMDILEFKDLITQQPVID